MLLDLQEVPVGLRVLQQLHGLQSLLLLSPVPSHPMGLKGWGKKVGGSPCSLWGMGSATHLKAVDQWGYHPLARKRVAGLGWIPEVWNHS